MGVSCRLAGGAELCEGGSARGWTGGWNAQPTSCAFGAVARPLVGPTIPVLEPIFPTGTVGKGFQARDELSSRWRGRRCPESRRGESPPWAHRSVRQTSEARARGTTPCVGTVGVSARGPVHVLV